MIRFIYTQILIAIVFSYGWYLTNDDLLKWVCVFSGAYLSLLVTYKGIDND